MKKNIPASLSWCHNHLTISLVLKHLNSPSFRRTFKSVSFMKEGESYKRDGGLEEKREESKNEPKGPRERERETWPPRNVEKNRNKIEIFL